MCSALVQYGGRNRQNPRLFGRRCTAAPQRVYRWLPRHQRGNSDQCQRTYTRHASFPPHIAMPTRCRSDLCTRCAQPVSTRSRSMQRTGVLLSEQSRAAQHAGHLRCQWRRSIRRCRRAAGAGLIRACSARRVKCCCQTQGPAFSRARHAIEVGLFSLHTRWCPVWKESGRAAMREGRIK